MNPFKYLFQSLFALALLTLSGPAVFAQITFQKSYVFAEDDVQIFSAIGTSDGGYAMSGLAVWNEESQMMLCKLNCAGEPEWTVLFGQSSPLNNTNNAILEGTDGNIYVLNSNGSYALSTRDVVVAKFSPDGNVIWIKNFGGDRNDTGRDMILTGDGNLVITGGTSSYGSDANSTTYSDSFLLKIDTDGNVLWSKTFGTNQNIDDGYAVAEDPLDGSLVMTGRYIVNGTFYTYLLKTDANGNINWFKAYGLDNHTNYGLDVTVDSDGNYVFVGLTTNYRIDFTSYADPFILKVEPNTGETLWTRILPPTDDYSDNASSILQLPNGDYLVGASVMSYSSLTEGFVPNKHAIYRISQSGDLTDARILNTGGSHYFTASSLPDGGLLGSGFSNQYTDPCCNFEPLLIRMDENLDSGCNQNNVLSLTLEVEGNWDIADPAIEEGTGFTGADMNGSETFNFDEVNTLCENFPLLIADFEPEDICEGQEISLEADGTGSPILWSWEMGDGEELEGQSITYSYETPGTYTITLTISDGCQEDQTSTEITVYPAPEVDPGMDQVIDFGESAELGGDPTTAPGNTVSWSPANSLNDASAFNPSASPSSTMTYYVTVTSPEGCESEDQVTVVVNDPVDPPGPDPETELGEFYIPNIFSPDDNSRNDIFFVYGGPYLDFDMRIYDRWGVTVFESTEQEYGWDGRYRGQEAGNGVYYYHFRGTNIAGETFDVGGNVTLIR